MGGATARTLPCTRVVLRSGRAPRRNVIFTGCGAEPRERFLPFLLQNRPFSKEILTFRTPL